MILEPNKIYFINFVPNSNASLETRYKGHGRYTGESMLDNKGNKLFWFAELAEEKGFTDKGWFTVEDIQNS